MGFTSNLDGMSGFAVNDAVHEMLSEWIADQSLRSSGTVVIGICGAQGSGKTTTCAFLKELLEKKGLTVGLASLDDFYLPRHDRLLLGKRVHSLLHTRGVPGTHDVFLASSVIHRLRIHGTLKMPTFDKAKDERSPQDEWRTVDAPVDVVLFEGWCVGAIPEPEEALNVPINDLERTDDANGVWRRYVNRALSCDYQTLFRQIDHLVLLAAPSFEVVHRWRCEQEDQLRQTIAGNPSATAMMDHHQLLRFVAHFERLTRHILREMPSRADVVVRLDSQRIKTIEMQPHVSKSVSRRPCKLSRDRDHGC
jgi:D-glycerate 3-kinase